MCWATLEDCNPPSSLDSFCDRLQVNAGANSSDAALVIIATEDGFASSRSAGRSGPCTAHAAVLGVRC
jgi:hypothetical protein